MAVDREGLNFIFASPSEERHHHRLLIEGECLNELLQLLLRRANGALEPLDTFHRHPSLVHNPSRSPQSSSRHRQYRHSVGEVTERVDLQLPDDDEHDE
jgi:hypothetical protein